MTETETIALIILWGKLAPHEPNCWNARCLEQAWWEHNHQPTQDELSSWYDELDHDNRWNYGNFCLEQAETRKVTQL